jgi:hypothetical protein
MDKALTWQGKDYIVGRLTMDEAERFLEVAESIGDLAPLAQFKASREMMTLLHCPAEVMAELPADEMADLLQALQAAHFGGGDDSGNPDGGAAAP